MYWGGYEIIIAKGFFFVNTKDSQICQKHLFLFVYFAQIIAEVINLKHFIIVNVNHFSIFWAYGIFLLFHEQKTTLSIAQASVFP